MIQLRTSHLIVGTAGFIAFVLTGQYMSLVHNYLQGMADGPRLFFRSAHIYLLWSSLLNLLLGCYLTRFTSGAARPLQFLASLAILAGPFLLGFSFFFEQYHPALTRPIGRWTILIAAGGAIGQAVAVFLARTKSRSTASQAVAVQSGVKLEQD